MLSDFLMWKSLGVHKILSIEVSLQKWSYSGHILTTCAHDACPLSLLCYRFIPCVSLLRKLWTGSTFYRMCVLRRSFDKKVYHKYYLKYTILSAPVAYLIGWSYHWKLEPLTEKHHLEVRDSFIL